MEKSLVWMKQARKRFIYIYFIISFRSLRFLHRHIAIENMSKGSVEQLAMHSSANYSTSSRHRFLAPLMTWFGTLERSKNK